MLHLYFTELEEFKLVAKYQLDKILTKFSGAFDWMNKVSSPWIKIFLLNFYFQGWTFMPGIITINHNRYIIIYQGSDHLAQITE